MAEERHIEVHDAGIEDLKSKVEKLYDVIFVESAHGKSLVSQVSYLEASYNGLRKSIEDLEAKVSNMSSKLDKYVYLGVSTAVGILVNIVIHVLK